MKKYTILGILLTGCALFSSCDDAELIEQPAPELMKVSSLTSSSESLITPAYTETLGSAKIYLTYDDVTNYDVSEPFLAADDRRIRMYVISDGSYTNSTGTFGYNLADFNDATYSIVITLISDDSGIIGTGDYAQTRDPLMGNTGSMQWISPMGTSSIMQNKYNPALPLNDILSIETGNQDNNAVKITDGTEDGQIMSVKFSGGIFIMVSETHDYYPSYSGHAVLNVTAPIIDVTGGVGARKSKEMPEIIAKLLRR